MIGWTGPPPPMVNPNSETPSILTLLKPPRL
jgi:hypothetical protein